MSQRRLGREPSEPELPEGIRAAAAAPSSDGTLG